MAAYLLNQLFQVLLAELQPAPAQHGEYMDPVALDEMTASIGQVGIIETMTFLKDTLEAAIARAVKNRKTATWKWKQHVEYFKGANNEGVHHRRGGGRRHGRRPVTTA